MSQKSIFAICLALLALGLTVMAVDAQGPKPTPPRPKAPTADIGTGFTYQGQLKNNGALVNGSCDFGFRLYDGASSGSLVGSAISKTILITNGLFTTSLDFGGVITGGVAVWLDMRVGCPSPAGSFTALSPRQALTPAPMAFALPGFHTQQNGINPPNVIGGYSGNTVLDGVAAATIGGGGDSGQINHISASYATISGGHFNTASGNAATVGGGGQNTASSDAATVGGGGGNTASGQLATIGGGALNTASGGLAVIGGGGGLGGMFGLGNNVSGNYSTIAGGTTNAASGHGAFIGGGGTDGTSISGNTASGNASTIPGGLGNSATMTYTFAAGRRAKAVNQGAFVWGDSTDANFSSTANNQFLIRAAGGAGIIDSGSSLSPTAQLHVQSSNTNVLALQSSAATGTWAQLNNTNGGTTWSIVSTGSGNGEGAGKLLFYNGQTRIIVDSVGKLTANGGFSGTCRTDGVVAGGPVCNQDFAEAFASTERTEPGDLIALVTQNALAPTVHKSSQPYETLLIGVVSQNPGLVFDNGETRMAGDNSQLITANKTVVALVGRVNVKASVENGAIAIGDPLTSSSRPGIAMKATHAGKIIGYAMQSAEHDGQLLALIQPGYYLPSDQLALAERTAQLEERVAALEQAGGTNARSQSNDWSAALAFVVGAISVVAIERTRRGEPK